MRLIFTNKFESYHCQVTIMTWTKQPKNGLLSLVLAHLLPHPLPSNESTVHESVFTTSAAITNLNEENTIVARDDGGNDSLKIMQIIL